jgi:hypothetical protein
MRLFAFPHHLRSRMGVAAQGAGCTEVAVDSFSNEVGPETATQSLHDLGPGLVRID